MRLARLFGEGQGKGRYDEVGGERRECGSYRGASEPATELSERITRCPETSLLIRRRCAALDTDTDDDDEIGAEYSVLRCLVLHQSFVAGHGLMLF